MKVRWSRGSFRLRITPTELEAVGRSETLCEAIVFPGGLFWNVTLLAGDIETVLASDAHGVSLSLSESDRAHLALPETEGVYYQWNGPQPLRYYVEKDFPCAHPRAAEALELATETFAAPQGFEERKLEAVIHGD